MAAGNGLTGGGTTGNVTLSVANSGISNTMLQNNSVNSAKIADGTITTSDIGSNQIVKSFNGLKDSVSLVAGSNISITPSGNNLTISSTGGDGGSVWSTNGTNAFYNTGNVGVGLNTPQNLLHLHRTDVFAGSPSVLRLTNITSGATATDGMILSLNNTVADFGLIGVLMMQENGSLGFGTNNTYQMFLKETGSLGLGTFNPQGKLDIFHNSGTTSPQLMISENENGGFGRISFRSIGVDGKYWTIAARTQATDASSQFNFYYFNGTSGQDIISINGNGNVGIGTLNPTAKLHINSSTSPAFRLSDGTNANGKVLVSDVDGNASWQDKSSRYTQSSLLNNNLPIITSTYASMGNFLTFTKVRDDSKIEVYFNSNVSGGFFAGAAEVTQFRLRINGGIGQFDNQGVIRGSGKEDFLSMMAVFTNLPAGTHIVSVWARTNFGTSTGALIDPGGWGGKIIV